VVVGGFAIRAAGWPRQTMDIDLLVLTGAEKEQLVKEAFDELPSMPVQSRIGRARLGMDSTNARPACLMEQMRHRDSIIRLALPATGFAAVVLLLPPTCRHDGESPAGQMGGGKAHPPAEAGIDPDKWAEAFANQVPPPAELERDPAEATGTFDNGLRYIVMEHPESAGRVSLRLLVRAGSVHEDEDERGYAHFVEHMAFRGTVHRPEGSALDHFERLGLKAGADTNAFTARDCTYYKLDIPDADGESLEKGFTFLRDVADGILFRESDVDAERRVVLREMDERRSGAAWDLRAAAILPEVRAAQRPPIGVSDVIERVTGSRLRDFWRRHYVPPRMVVIAAGDLQRKETIARIVRHFAGLPARDAPPEPVAGEPVTGEGATVQCVPHPAADGRIAVTIAAPQPVDREPDSPEKRRRELVRHIGLAMLEQRLNRTASPDDAGIARFLGSEESVAPRLGWLEIAGLTKEPEVKPSLEYMAREWRRARDTGFNDAEFAAARGETRKELRRRFLSRMSRSAADMASALMQSEWTGRLCESPEVELNRARTDLGGITRAECEELFHLEWNRPALRIVLSGEISTELEGAAEEIVRRAWARAPNDAPAAKDPRLLQIASFGNPGHFVRRTVDKDRGYLEAEFANHVIVRLKPVAALGGMASVRVLAGHGKLSVPPERPGLALAAHLLTHWYPLAGWRRRELDAALANTEAGADFDVGDHAFVWNGETDRATLGRQLELLCACIARPGPPSFRDSWRPGNRERAWAEGLVAARDPVQRALQRTLSCDDSRFHADANAFLSTNSRQVEAWMTPILKESRLCVLIAGDFSPGAAMQSLARTFGALPERAAWDGPCPYPALEVPEPCVSRERPGSCRTAAAMLSIPVKASQNPAGDLQLGLLDEIASLRLRRVLRESLGASYSPDAFTGRSSDLTHDWVGGYARCAEGRSEETGEALRAVFRDLHRDGWTDDEFRRAARPLAYTLRAAARRPDWWLSSLVEPDICPPVETIDAAALLKMEPQVRELARRALDTSAAIELRVEPHTGDETE
jgi:zinc protease